MRCQERRPPQPSRSAEDGSPSTAQGPAEAGARAEDTPPLTQGEVEPEEGRACVVQMEQQKFVSRADFR